jgi:hypothetical protein
MFDIWYTMVGLAAAEKTLVVAGASHLDDGY